MIEFKLPNLGEGMESGTVVGVLVKPGDVLQADQPVLEIEADKATVELPCPHAGEVKTIHVKEGDKVFNDPGGAAGMADIPDKELDGVIESAEECPGECIFIEAE